MKKIVGVFMLILTMTGISIGQNDAIAKFYGQYESDPEFTVVYVSPKMFKMLGKVAGDEMEQDMKSFVEDLKGLKVLSTDKNGLALYKEAMNKIPTSSYDELVKVRDKGQNVRILSKGDDAANFVDELLIVVGEQESFTLVSFVGHLDLNKLSKLAKNLDIKGAEHLENIGE